MYTALTINSIIVTILWLQLSKVISNVAFRLHTGILYVTNTDNKLTDVHKRLTAQNLSLHILLEEAERSHDRKSRDQGKDTPSLQEADRRTIEEKLEKLRIETTV